MATKRFEEDDAGNREPKPQVCEIEGHVAIKNVGNTNVTPITTTRPTNIWHTSVFKSC